MKCSNCNAPIDYVDAPNIKCPFCDVTSKNPEFRKQNAGSIGDIVNQAFQDTDGDGTPDIFQGNQNGKNVSFSSVNVTVNGKQTDNLDALPDEFKEMFKSIGSGGAPMQGEMTSRSSNIQMTTTTSQQNQAFGSQANKSGKITPKQTVSTEHNGTPGTKSSSKLPLIVFLIIFVFVTVLTGVVLTLTLI